MRKAPHSPSAPRSRGVPPPLSLGGGAVSQAQKQLFVEFLAARRLKLTRQREAVVDEILANPGHFEAEEIVQLLKDNRQRVSRATVYRTLDLLKDCLLVERLDFGTNVAYYEHVEEGSHHDHLICLRCGNVIEFHNEKLEKIQTDVCEQFEFTERYHSLRIFGLCGKCRRTAN